MNLADGFRAKDPMSFIPADSQKFHVGHDPVGDSEISTGMKFLQQQGDRCHLGRGRVKHFIANRAWLEQLAVII